MKSILRRGFKVMIFAFFTGVFIGPHGESEEQTIEPVEYYGPLPIPRDLRTK